MPELVCGTCREEGEKSPHRLCHLAMAQFFRWRGGVEAMNHAGDIRPDMLVVLNDNEMSISEKSARSITIWHSCFPVSFTLRSRRREKDFCWRSAN
ncbi:1-deoxy-D-xylulose-5-phosphate synthase N-terminal domain-containing protein [Escherichia coli]